MKTNSKITIIAEAGVNHNGDLNTAYKLVDAAAEAGADYVKFQSFVAEKLVSKKALKAKYQTENIGNDDVHQFQMLKKVEMDEAFHKEIMAYCKEKNIGFLSSPFDEDSIEFLYDLGLRLFKVPSGEITNLPYLQKLGKLKCAIILSTGMATMQEIEKALDVFKSAGLELKDITVLHCTTDYPTDFMDVNLEAMPAIGRELGVKVGYSDHTTGIEVPIAAAAKGAGVIEKHITLNKEMKGPDHKASLEPVEFKQMVEAVRNIEQAIGDGVKKPTESEIKNKSVVRKSIHINRDLEPGAKITKNDLIMLRPGDGISPMEYESIIGMKTAKALEKGHKLNQSDLRYSK